MQYPSGATHYRISRFDKTIYYKFVGNSWFWKLTTEQKWRPSRRPSLVLELISIVKDRTLTERLMDAF